MAFAWLQVASAVSIARDVYGGPCTLLQRGGSSSARIGRKPARNARLDATPKCPCQSGSKLRILAIHRSAPHDLVAVQALSPVHAETSLDSTPQRDRNSFEGARGFGAETDPDSTGRPVDICICLERSASAGSVQHRTERFASNPSIGCRLGNQSWNAVLVIEAPSLFGSAGWLARASCGASLLAGTGTSLRLVLPFLSRPHQLSARHSQDSGSVRHGLVHPSFPGPGGREGRLQGSQRLGLLGFIRHKLLQLLHVLSSQQEVGAVALFPPPLDCLQALPQTQRGA